MERRDRGIVCLGNESRGRGGKERTAETKETYGALTHVTPTLFCEVALTVPLWLNCPSVPYKKFENQAR